MPDQDRTTKLMRRVCHELEAGRPHDAVRLFVSGVDHGLIAPGNDTPKRLARVAGTRRAARLIKAFADYPCMACKKGLENCEACKDRQRASWRKRACERCLDFGMARCDFCDGAGWVTYNFIPEGLRMAVVVERTNRALKEIEALLRQSLPAPTETNVKKLAQALEKQIVSLNRAAGVLENALIASKSGLSDDPTSGKLANKIIKICRRTWPRLESQLRELLLKLAEALRLQAAQASAAPARELMQDRARFYEMLSRSNGFPRTGLEHPFLSRKG